MIYVKKLCKGNSVAVEFFLTTFCVKDSKTKTTILVGRTEDGLYQLPSAQGHQFTNNILLHDRLGHPHLYRVKHVFRSMNKDLYHISDSDVCNSHQMA